MPKGLKQPWRKRFWLYVPVERADDECWLWQGSVKDTGYGVLGVYGRIERAHRLSYILHRGKIPLGMVVRHTCNNRRCVNPNHLLLGTQGDNNRDTARAGTNSGVNSVHAKLNPEIAVAMRQERKDGATHVAIGRKYGVCEATVRAAIYTERWLPLVQHEA